MWSHTGIVLELNTEKLSVLDILNLPLHTKIMAASPCQHSSSSSSISQSCSSGCTFTLMSSVILLINFNLVNHCGHIVNIMDKWKQQPLLVSIFNYNLIIELLYLICESHSYSTAIVQNKNAEFRHKQHTYGKEAKNFSNLSMKGKHHSLTTHQMSDPSSVTQNFLQNSKQSLCEVCLASILSIFFTISTKGHIS